MECPVVYVGPELYQTLDILANVSVLLFSYRISVMAIIPQNPSTAGPHAPFNRDAAFPPSTAPGNLDKIGTTRG